MRNGDWEERDEGWGERDGQRGWRLEMREKNGRQWEDGGWVLKRWGMENWQERDGRWSPLRKVSWVRTSRAPPQLCDTRGLQGRSDVRAPCFFLSWIKSPLDYIWPPFFVSPTPPHKR